MDLVLIASLVLTFIVSLVFRTIFGGRIAPPPSNRELPIQWVWYSGGGYAAIRIGSGLEGFDLVGFLLPLTLWIIFTVIGKAKLDLKLGRSYFSLLLGTIFIAFLFMRITMTGSVYMFPGGEGLIISLATLIAFLSRWERAGVYVFLHMTAVWFGIALIDILVGTRFLLHGSGIIGGTTGSLGDGLWFTPLYASLMMLVGHLLRNYLDNGSEMVEDSEHSI